LWGNEKYPSKIQNMTCEMTECAHEVVKSARKYIMMLSSVIAQTLPRENRRVKE
jgi:hypothetical protein